MCCVYLYMFDVGFNQTEPHGRVWCCRHAPFLIAFQERAQVFTTVVGQDRMEQREMGMREGYGWGRQYFVTIHRTTLLQVSITTMSDPEYNPHWLAFVLSLGTASLQLACGHRVQVRCCMRIQRTLTTCSLIGCTMSSQDV